MTVKIDFVKMHGAGNDFIMIEDIDDRVEASPGLIASLCEFHRGIGADGLIFLRKSREADFLMKYYNRDGGEADMCGNGARCTALFAREKGIAGSSMAFETKAGIVKADVLDDGVRIGIARVSGLKLYVKCEQAEFETHFVKAGVPHAVLLSDDAASHPKEEFLCVASAIRSDPVFMPEGANVNLVTVTASDTLAYRTYERGVEAETLACGTGAVAAAVIAAHLNLADPPVTCETSGGDDLVVDFRITDDGAENCSLKGPAVVTFKGSFRLPDYLE
jgi:diaminopimelate epimerase